MNSACTDIFCETIPGSQPIEACWQRIVREIKEEYLDQTQIYPWVVGFSGGKDSTLLVHAIIEAILDIPIFKRERGIFILTNDTLVESPVVLGHLEEILHDISSAILNLGLPIKIVKTKPDLDKTFWVLLIGKGYPSPNQQMRWCTDRLKILPTSNFIKTHVSQSGGAIVVLGVRKEESNSRSNIIDKYRNLRGSRLTKHESLAGAFIYRPIVNLSTIDLWDMLLNLNPPWGGTHGKLIQLYRESKGGECPVVLTSDEAYNCGSSSSRFGCWTCTVVEKDKSLQGFIDSGNEHFKPLLHFRDWLRKIRNNPKKRKALRRNGKLTFNQKGMHIPGPFTIQARKEILDKLMETQMEYGKDLISTEEVDIIYQIWSKEIQEEDDIANS